MTQGSDDKGSVDSHTLLQALLDSLDTAVFVVAKPDRTISDCNEAAATIFGYPRRDMIGRDTRFLHLDDDYFQRFGAWSTAVLRQEQTFRGDYFMRRADGRTFLSRHVVTLLQPERGLDSTVVSIIRDLTDVHAPQWNDSRAEGSLRVAADHTLDALLTIDAQSRIVYANAATHRMFRHEAGSLLGLPLAELIPPRLRERHEQAISRYLQTGEPSLDWAGIELPGLRGDGTECMLQLSFSSYRIDDQHYFTAIARDVSEQHRTAEALRASELRFRQIAEHMPSVFWITDRNKEHMEYVSPAFEAVWGRPRTMLYDHPEAWLDAIHPEDRPRIRQALPSQIHGDYRESYRILRPDGELRWIQDRAFPVADEQGRVYRIIGIAEDITEQRQLEEQLRQSQKLDAIGRLAGGVAHDFNNLLTVIQAQAQLVLDGLEQDSALRINLEDTLRDIGQASELVQQLMTFSRRQPLSQETLDLREQLRAMESLLRRLLPERIELQFDYVQQPACIVGDPNRLHQAILNLAVNARQAIDGHGRIRFAVEVDDSGQEAGSGAGTAGWVVLRVEDDGCGMSAEVRERIFEPFFTTKPTGEGTGLGLSMVFAIVEQSGGNIEVASVINQGSSFRLRFPRLPAAAIKPAAGSRPPDAPDHAPGVTTGASILLVEDQPSLRKIAEQALTRRGHQVLSAGDGSEALRVAADHGASIDVVVSDMVMPGMNGVELIEHLRRARPDLRVVLMSGYSDSELPPDFRDQRVRFLAKPFSMNDLDRVVRELIET